MAERALHGPGYAAWANWTPVSTSARSLAAHAERQALVQTHVKAWAGVEFAHHPAVQQTDEAHALVRQRPRLVR